MMIKFSQTEITTTSDMVRVYPYTITACLTSDESKI